jgi:hypothetical protein
MSKEREQMLKALEEARKPYTFSEKTKIRFLERIPSEDKEMRAFFYKWLSCTMSEEQSILKQNTVKGMSKSEAVSFTQKFHGVLLEDSTVSLEQPMKA